MLYNSGEFLIFYFPLLLANPIINWQKSECHKIATILKNIRLEKQIEVITIFKAFERKESCLCDENIKEMATNNTVIIVASNSTCSHLEEHTTKVLLVSCLSFTAKTETFDIMNACLRKKRSLPIVFINNDNIVNTTLQERSLLKQHQIIIFSFLGRKHIINVIVIYRDYEIDGHFYTYTNFPEFQLERKRLDEPYFPDRIKNLKGYALKTLPNQLEPWSLVWYDANKRLQIGGMVHKILIEFARRHNATLTYPVKIDACDAPSVSYWLKLLQDEKLDILSGITTTEKEGDVDISTSLINLDWTVMIPLPPIISELEVFWFLLTSMYGICLLLLLFGFTFSLTLGAVLSHRRYMKQNSYIKTADSFSILLCILINTVFRSVIGQTSCTNVRISTKYVKRFLFSLLFVSGIIMTSLFSACFQSYLTSPIRYPRIESFGELIQAGIVLKMDYAEYVTVMRYISPQELENLSKIITFSSSFSEIQAERISLDTNYAYVVLSSMWVLLERYQSNLPQPLFYISKHIYLVKSVQMVIPLQNNSIFKTALNDMIINMQNSGITKLWIDQIYDDMLVAGKLNNTRGKLYNNNMKTLDMCDFYYIWILFSVGMFLAILTFFIELWYYRRTMIKRERVENRMKENAETIVLR